MLLLLRTYARDREPESALDALENMRTSSNEKVSDYNRILAAVGRDLTGVYTQDDLMTRFTEGIPYQIIEQKGFQRPCYKEVGAFVCLVNHMEALHNSYLHLPIQSGTVPVKFIS